MLEIQISKGIYVPNAMQYNANLTASKNKSSDYEMKMNLNCFYLLLFWTWDSLKLNYILKVARTKN